MKVEIFKKFSTKWLKQDTGGGTINRFPLEDFGDTMLIEIKDLEDLISLLKEVELDFILSLDGRRQNEYPLITIYDSWQE